MKSSSDPTLRYARALMKEVSTTVAAFGSDTTDAGHRERIAELFDLHHDRLYRLSLRMARDPEEASDLLQDVFLRASRAPRSIPQGGDALPFLIRILTNLCRDRYRRAAVRRAFAVLNPRRDAVDPRDALIAAGAVHAAVAQLPPRQRMIVILAELEDHSPADIAALLGIRPATVRWHLYEARAKLAATLAEKLPEQRS